MPPGLLPMTCSTAWCNAEYQSVLLAGVGENTGVMGLNPAHPIWEAM